GSFAHVPRTLAERTDGRNAPRLDGRRACVRACGSRMSSPGKADAAPKTEQASARRLDAAVAEAPVHIGAAALQDRLGNRGTLALLRRYATIQRACCAGCDCEEEPKVQRAADGESSESAARGLVARATGGGGAPLDPTLRADFEPRLGRDLGGVRVHTDGS